MIFCNLIDLIPEGKKIMITAEKLSAIIKAFIN